MFNHAPRSLDPGLSRLLALSATFAVAVASSSHATTLRGRNACRFFNNQRQVVSPSPWETRRGVHRRYRTSEAMTRLAAIAPMRINLRNSFRYDSDSYCVWSDMSAVVDKTPDSLMVSATNYNRYTQMGMPHVQRSEIVNHTGNHFLIFNVMSLAVFTSRHYLQAALRPNLDGEAQLLAWRLVRRRNDDPSFHGMVGSFYTEPVVVNGEQKTYIRYFLKAQLNNGLLGIPGASGIVSRIMRNEFGTGVKSVIDIISRNAR